jgi:hypothetical protein
MRETISLNLAHWKSDYLLQFTQSSVAIAPKLNIKFGAGAVGAWIVGAGAAFRCGSGSGSTKIKMLLAAPAPNFMFNIGRLSKMSHTVTVLYFSFFFYDKLTHKKSSEKFVLTLICTFVCYIVYRKHCWQMATMFVRGKASLCIKQNWFLKGNDDSWDQ